MSRNSENLDEVLDKVISAIPGGEDRPQQREMAAAVDSAFRSGRHLAVQGPTGVGKSIAYLVPAILAAHRGERTVIVTSSKALQDQLAKVEVPFLASVLGTSFRFAVLKGRSNYLCEAAATEVKVGVKGFDQQGFDLDVDTPTDADRLSQQRLGAEIEAILEWAETTHTGDMAELPETPHWQTWSTVSVGPGECIGAAKCSHADDCWSEKARAEAFEADILVVNAHLYGAHIQTGRSLLPDHSLLVIDEAHEFEDSIVGSLAVEMTATRLENLARGYKRCVAEEEKVARVLRMAGEDLESALAARGAGRLHDGLDEDGASAIAAASTAAERALNALKIALRAAGEGTAKHRIERTIRSADSVLADSEALLAKHSAGSVMWIEGKPAGRHALRLTRIDVASTLRKRVWDEGGPTVVCCSATLDSGTAGRLGLDAEYLAVPSPFDFAANAVLYVPKIHPPKHPSWPEEVADEIGRLIRAANGRTLALFTSNRMLRETVERCRSQLEEFEILAQGDAPNPVLQERFLDNEHASLFATASFWTGMSSPGTTCSVVVIDKIPFPVPSDPIVEARCELIGDAAFMEVSIPAAGMQLAQGVGRLIRTAEDRGVVAVCDPRLAEARYRSRMLDLLPPMRRVRNREFVERFIAELNLDGVLPEMSSPLDQDDA